MNYIIDKNVSSLKGAVLGLPRLVKRFLVITLDLTLCVLTTWLAYCLRLGEFTSLFGNRLILALVSIMIVVPIFSA